MPRADTEAMNLHLIEISQSVSPGAHAVLVIENVSADLRGNKLAQRLYDTYTGILDACCDAWNSFMAAPDVARSSTARKWATGQNI